MLRFARCWKATLKNMLCLVILTISGVFWYATQIHPFSDHPNIPITTPNIIGWLVNSSSCQIPDYHPWDDSIKHVITEGKPFAGCRQTAIVKLEQQDDMLFMKVTSKKCSVDCCYQSVERASEGHSDDKYRITEHKTCFQGRPVLQIRDEFIRVRCFCNKPKNIILEDFRAFIVSKPTIRNFTQPGGGEKTKEYPDVRNQATLNVYLIGIDSVSRLNFKRFWPDVEQLLVDEYNAIPMLGFTKVGLNTFPNMLAFLAGLTYDQLNISLSKEPLDKLPLVWKQFSQLEYVTMLTEDTPKYATFNYIKKGFYTTPTDYYLRPMHLAIEYSRFLKSQHKNCINQRQQNDFQLQWLEDFMSRVNHKPQFAFLFSNALSHDGPLIYVKSMQGRLLKFFQWYKNSERYNSSILIFFSDHGLRVGPVMRYELGGYESRMPFFYIILPPWYSVRYPDRVKNLEQNSARLTTFFDAHATLRHILRDIGATHLPHVNNSGISLFETVPAERSCEQAGINDHWCVCRSRKPMSVNEPAIQRAAVATVEHINEVKLREVRALCAKLNLLKINTAFHRSSRQPTNEENNYNPEPSEEYVVQFVTQPGLAEFEATVRDQRSGPPKVVDVSRLNMYRGQSDCLVRHYDERRFCYCENLL